VRQSTRRLLTYGSNATLVTAMVLAMVVLLYVLADKYRTSVDLTEGASNTLQGDTVEKLRLIEMDGVPVEITAFTNQRGKEDSFFKDRAVKDLLREIGNNSATVSYRIVDFDSERLTAERLGVSDYGHIVIQRGKDRVDLKDRELFRRAGKERRMEFIGETAVSRGFSQLMTPTRRAVYVLTGHGDLDLDDKGPGGLSDLGAALDGERYDLETLDLLRTTREGELPSVPDDAAVLFVARPRAALTPQEEDAVLAWIGRGGAVLFALDVGTPAPALLERAGVRLIDGVALQPEVQVPHPDRPIPRYKSHPINEELIEAKLATVLSFPAPLQILDGMGAGMRISPLLSTSRDGWIDRGGKVEGGMAVYEPTIDGAGPVDLAVAVELAPGAGLVRSSKKVGRLVVIGDGDLFTNALLGEAPGNLTFALNVIHWLAGEDRRLGVDTEGIGKPRVVRRLALTQEEMGTLRLITLGLMPLLVVLGGVITWFFRRGR